MYGHRLVTNRLYICRSRMTSSDKRKLTLKLARKLKYNGKVVWRNRRTHN